jgi:hypothetical protein
MLFLALLGKAPPASTNPCSLLVRKIEDSSTRKRNSREPRKAIPRGWRLIRMNRPPYFGDVQTVGSVFATETSSAA